MRAAMNCPSPTLPFPVPSTAVPNTNRSRFGDSQFLSSTIRDSPLPLFHLHLHLHLSPNRYAESEIGALIDTLVGALIDPLEQLNWLKRQAVLQRDFAAWAVN
uniref:Uncharacterized protein n=1 Tax=Kalanchoe fedtschenkoi TaxID=63787 RepID=A0A7N0UEG1_KALFE